MKHILSSSSVLYYIFGYVRELKKKKKKNNLFILINKKCNIVACLKYLREINYYENKYNIIQYE